MDVKVWFLDNTDKLYSNLHVPFWVDALTSVLLTLIFAGTAYKITENHFKDPMYDENMTKLKQLIKLEKKIHKGKATDDNRADHSLLKNELQAIMEGDKRAKHRKNQVTLNDFYIRVNSVKKDEAINGDDDLEMAEKLLVIDQELDALKDQLDR